LFNTRTVTIHSVSNAGCVGMDGGSVVYLTVSNVTSTPTFSSNWSDHASDGVMHNADFYWVAVYLLSSSKLYPLRCGGGYGWLLLPTPPLPERKIKVACLITTITRHRLFIVWHQHSVAVIIRNADISKLLYLYSTCHRSNSTRPAIAHYTEN
jgi:hypothetical protein